MATQAVMRSERVDATAAASKSVSRSSFCGLLKTFSADADAANIQFGRGEIVFTCRLAVCSCYCSHWSVFKDLLSKMIGLVCAIICAQQFK
jgi:hypothetical protein